MTQAVPSYLSPSGQEVVFLLLSVVMVGSALLVVLTRQLVHAALWLVVCFGALAGGYLVLTAEFVAWVQVLIYVGAVVVLLLFGIMLTRAPIGRSADLNSGNRAIAALVSLATAAVLITVVVDGFRTAYTPLNAGHGAAGALGASVFRTWVLPFEALSVLLLAALIGAIVLSRTDIAPTSRPPSNRTPSPKTPNSAVVSPTVASPASPSVKVSSSTPDRAEPTNDNAPGTLDEEAQQPEPTDRVQEPGVQRADTRQSGAASGDRRASRGHDGSGGTGPATGDKREPTDGESASGQGGGN
ncbi:NADH-quinone oxidoreductase subunit J [Nonomuraea sp. NPDC050556]|uniref:NADH-quinone oxidoreductase subunit J n=1 Tax=Nonomuraea sp. NPDC050556 TaxID=3364369 RepID=UPI0037BCB3F9